MRGGSGVGEGTVRGGSMVGHGWPRGGNGRNGPEQGPGPLDGSSLGVEMASLTQNKGLEPMTDTDQKKTWILTILTTARQIRNGRPNFGLTRGVTHMGCPVGETAGRADPTGQKSHRLLLTKPGHGPWPKTRLLWHQTSASGTECNRHATRALS